jgi:hypothetical protein
MKRPHVTGNPLTDFGRLLSHLWSHKGKGTGRIGRFFHTIEEHMRREGGLR